MRLLQHLHEHGFRFFKCNNDKTPQVRWKDASNYITSEEAVQHANSGGYIGAVVPEGYFVVDIDPKNNAEALHEFLTLNPPIQTLIITTPSGGYHYYYRGKASQTQSPVSGIDIRANNRGYVIVPPSRGYTVKSDEIIIHAWDFFESNRETQETVSQGRRNTAMTHLAGILRAEGKTEAEILECLRLRNDEMCNPPLPDKELQQIATGMGNYTQGWLDESEEEILADAFQTGHTKNIRYNEHDSKWYIFKQGFWQPCITYQSAIRYGLKSYRDMLAMRGVLTNGWHKSSLGKLLKRLGDSRHYSACEKLLKNSVHTTRPEYDDYELPVANGLVNMCTGKLRPYDSETFAPIVTDIVYDPEARAPRWEQFIKEVTCGDRELALFLQQLCWYVSTGSTREQKIFIFEGIGANGKSTLTDILRQILGKFAVPGRAKKLLDFDKQSEYETATLAGRRLVTLEEFGVRNLDEADIKMLTGAQELTGRWPYGKPFTFENRAKIIANCNEVPIIRGTDRGIWRRIVIVPFKACFENNKDPFLREKLEDEKQGILNWIIAGAYDGTLHCPPATTREEEELRREMDQIESFAQESGIVITGEDSDLMRARDFITMFRAWQEMYGYIQWTPQLIGRRIRNKGVKKVQKLCDDKICVFYKGIKRA